MTEPPSRPAQGLIAATLLGALSMLHCAVPEVHGAPAQSSGRDAGRGDCGEVGAASKLPDPVEGAKPEAYGSELIGLTRGQLETRRGPPTEKHGNRWTYTPSHQGCSDREMSEVFTFKNDRVAKLALVRRQTGKVCGFDRQRPP
jgi:hypothetical protein